MAKSPLCQALVWHSGVTSKPAPADSERSDFFPGYGTKIPNLNTQIPNNIQITNKIKRQLFGILNLVTIY
jgi:hypothetical protein